MQRTPKDQNIHDDMVRNLITAYNSKGYTNIKADHVKFNNGQPEMVNGHVPDVSANINGKVVICEAETMESLKDPSTIQQWKAFAKSDSLFHVVVPGSAVEMAKKMASENGILVYKYWVNKNY